jgi:predicted HD phosphohydrolase
MSYEDAAQSAHALQCAVRAYRAHAPDGIAADTTAQMFGALVGALVAAHGPARARHICSSIIDTLEAAAERTADAVPDDVLELELPEGFA